MEALTSGIFKALAYLFIAAVVAIAHEMGRKNAQEKGLAEALWEGMLCCAGIALFATFTLGQPTCLERADPMSGGCIEYADDGFEATSVQRIATFGYFMTLLSVPVALGVFKAKDEIDPKNGEKNR